jgi:hypothetical protein
MRSPGAPHPVAEPGFLVGNRRHFGWPFWAVYLDAGSEEHSGRDAWYVKIDLWKSAANSSVAILLGIVAAGLAEYLRRRRYRGVPNHNLPVVPNRANAAREP